MVVWTEAEHISHNIRAIVRRTERLDVVCFCVERAIPQRDPFSADLATKAMHSLNPLRQSRIPENTIGSRLHAFSRDIMKVYCARGVLRVRIPGMFWKRVTVLRKTFPSSE